MKSKLNASQQAEAEFNAKEYDRMADELRRVAALLRAFPQGDIAMADRLDAFAQQIGENSGHDHAAASMHDDLTAALRQSLSIGRPRKK